MITYLQKYNRLPRELRAKISAPAALSAITEMEKKHNVALAGVVMRVMVRDISLLDLNKYFVFEYNLDGRHADRLVEELKMKVFAPVADYLGFIPDSERPEEDKSEVNRWLKERADEAVVRSSNFFFSPEDEEEVKILAHTLEQTSVKERETADWIEIRAEKIIKETKISLSSGDLMNRLKSVIGTFLRGTRNKIDAKLTLMRGVHLGGLEFDEKIADRIMAAAVKAKEEKIAPEAMKPPARIPVPEDGAKAALTPAKGAESIGTRDPAYDFSRLAAEKKTVTALTVPLPPAINLKQADKVPGEPKAEKPAGAETEKKESVIDLKTAEKSALKPYHPWEKIPFAEIVPKAAPRPLAEAAGTIAGQDAGSAVSMAQARKAVSPNESAAAIGKVRMDDIKYVPKSKLTGPVDELREMSLVDFRRLSDNPLHAAANIKAKIKMLEEENYSQRLAGIKAWRESPVNNLYLEIGQDSIGRHQSIEEIIKSREKESKDYLTHEEFTAIMDLNKDLRF